MKTVKSKITKKIKLVLVLYILFGIIFANVNVMLLYSNLQENDPFFDNANKIEKIKDYEINTPKTSEFENYFGNGQQLSVFLHQSLVNTTIKEFTNLDTFNTFTEAAPEFNNFNSSFVNITVSGLKAPNESLIIEDVYSGRWPLDAKVWTSFEVRGSCVLDNISIQVRNNGGLERYLINVWNATLSGSYIKYDTDLNGLNDVAFIDQPDTGANNIWINATNLSFNLDADNTYNNTFFISVSRSQTWGEWVYENEGNGDDTITWDDGAVAPYDRDQDLKVDIAPLNNAPKPSQIGLKINGSYVSDDLGGSNKGYWSHTDEYQGMNGKLDFVLSAEYWDVSCNITNALINYTKTDLKASSNFDIPSSGQEVQWNVSVAGGLNYFDARINNFNTINFTIPETWTDPTIQVFNATTEKTDLVKRVLGNGYREVQVLNAGNGTNWYLIANSANLLSTIDTYVGSVYTTQVNFTDIVRFNATFNEIISNGNLNLSVFSPTSPRYLNYSNLLDLSTLTPDLEFNVSDWDISKNATDYGVFNTQISWNNGTAAGFLEMYFTVIANTDLILISPVSGQSHFDNELFNVTVFYNNTGPNSGDIGIIGASITENSTLLGPPTPTGIDGYYSLQLNTTKFNYGWNYIEINASKSFYQNQSFVFSFHHRINTTISPSNNYNFGDVIRGDTVSYTLNYSDVLNNPILGATIQDVSLPSGFVSNQFEVGGAPGNYTLQLITSNVQASVSAYTCIFNISATGKQTQVISLILTVIQAQTSLNITSYIGILNRKDGFDQQIEFFFNDTDNDQGVPGITTGDIIVTENQTGGLRSINSLVPLAGVGNYRLNISISDLDSGWIRFGVNVSRDPDYNWSSDYFDFYLRGNLTMTSIESIRDVGGQGILTPTVLNYSVYIGLNVNINFTILDTDFGNSIVTGDANSYLVNYYQFGNPVNQGTLSNTLDFDLNTDSYKGIISSSNLATTGTYAINVTIFKTNYETSTIKFNLTIIPKILINVSAIESPVRINAGTTFDLTFKVEYYNGTSWVAFSGIPITLIPNFDGLNSTSTSTLITNINGTVTFTEVTVGNAVKIMIIYAKVNPAYNYNGFTRVISDIAVIPPPSLWEQLLPYLIIGGIAVLAVAGSVAVYRGVVVPKKREKQRILTEVKTIFDDAINLEHVLVLYKGTGTCIFFKSYGSEEIDPELIGGFLTAVSSFGKEMVAQEALNEISYGDKMLLLADGEYIRVALVLGKKASLILRSHLKEFIDAFEKAYGEILPKWRGQLNHFKNAGEIVDDLLNTSIILPHQISYDFADVKDLKNPHSRELLKVAQSCCEEADRKFFFIATLLKDASEKTNKDTAEIFMGIKELRDKKILLPIEISAIEAQPISQQEVNLINQKVAQITNLSNEEKQKLVGDLAQLGPAEREAYLSSLSDSKKIVSAPIKTTIGTVEVEDKKAAKKEMGNLIKKAKSAKSEGQFSESIDAMQNAAMLASNWDFPNELLMIQEKIRKLQIEELKINKKKAENEAKIAVKQKIYSEAATKYQLASKIASQIFKLGDPSMTKEVKRLTNKAKEYEKL